MFSYDYIYLSSRHRRPEEGRSAPRSHPQEPPAAPAASRPGHPPTGRGRATAPALAGRGLPPPADSSPAPLPPSRLDPPRAPAPKPGWTPRDIDRALDDALATRGGRPPHRINQPAAYLATLLRPL